MYVGVTPQSLSHCGLQEFSDAELNQKTENRKSGKRAENRTELTLALGPHRPDIGNRVARHRVGVVHHVLSTGLQYLQHITISISLNFVEGIRPKARKARHINSAVCGVSTKTKSGRFVCARLTSSSWLLAVRMHW